MRLSWLLVLLAACPAPEATDAPTDEANTFDADPSTTLGDGRTAEAVLPSDYDITNTYPLVLMLHGYGANAFVQDAVFGLQDRVDSHQFILILADGTVDAGGAQFWNAFDECCDFYGTNVKDSRWLAGLIEEAQGRYPISHVAVMGHSNGGFMSYRMACERPDLVDRIAPLAGTLSAVDSECDATDPVRVLHMHGTDDTTIGYDTTGGHRGALDSVAYWADLAGCSGPVNDGTRDHHENLTGDETTVQTWDCPTGDLELWTAEGGDHIYLFNNSAYKDDLASWLVAP